MSGFYSNSSSSVFATESELNNLTSTVAPDMMQHFKNVAGFNPVALVGSGDFNTLTGYQVQSILPGDNFSVASPGVFQYNGLSSNVFFVAYDVSGFIPIDSPITFLLTRDNAILPASAQIQDFLTNSYETVSGSMILELNPGQQIAIKASLLAVGPTTFQLENIKLCAFKIAPF